MLTSGVFKLIEVKRSGVTADKKKYVHVLAVDFFNQNEKDSDVKTNFFILKAFGSTAEFIERNISGARRAFVTGELDVTNYMDKMEVSKKLTFNGQSGSVKFKVDVEKTSLSINITNIRFLDKPHDSATTFIADDSDDDEVVFSVEDDDTTTSGSSSFVINTEDKKSKAKAKDEEELPPRGKRR